MQEQCVQIIQKIYTKIGEDRRLALRLTVNLDLAITN
jgi:hypothetical protein